MAVCTKSLLIVLSASGAVATVGGLILWKWLKRLRHGHHQDSGHGHHHSTFDDISIMLAYHYAPPSEYEFIPEAFKTTLDYPVRLANICKRQKTEGIPSRAMDIGCSVGRICFELAASYDEVIGVDVSETALNAANQLRKEGEFPYTVRPEGQIIREYKAVVNPDIDRNRVRFIMADGCDLPKGIGQFGLIVLSMTLHHLPDPMEFLEVVADLIVPSGILVIAESYTWHEMMDLPKDRWIAGFTKRNGDEVRGPEGLKNCLSSKFALVEEDNLHTVLSTRSRMFHLAVPHVTIWMRKKE